MSVYFNIRNTLPKFRSFILGHLYTYQVIGYYLVMNKGPWGGRGAEVLKSDGVVGWNVGFSASGNVTRF